MEEVTPLNYYLASAADVIAVQPGGHFAVGGFSSEVMFYRGFFDKVGVQPQFLRHGRYKSFEEPYTRKSLSPEARGNLEAYLASSWGYYLDAVSASRRMTRDSVAKVLASGDIDLGHARRAGLIDTLVDQDQLRELAGGKGAGWIRLDGEAVRDGSWEIQPRIALVVVRGDMVMGRSAPGWLGSPELAGARSVADQLKRARKDPEIKAVVLRVDSPGGSAQAADIMAREVELLRKAGKPVIASVGHMAASGGYYLICGADRIYSSHNSALGSIGILWGKFVLKGLYDKLGLATETVKTTPHADASSMSRPWDSAEVEILQRHMDQLLRSVHVQGGRGAQAFPGGGRFPGPGAHLHGNAGGAERPGGQHRGPGRGHPRGGAPRRRSGGPERGARGHPGPARDRLGRRRRAQRAWARSTDGAPDMANALRSFAERYESLPKRSYGRSAPNWRAGQPRTRSRRRREGLQAREGS